MLVDGLPQSKLDLPHNAFDLGEAIRRLKDEQDATGLE